MDRRGLDPDQYENVLGCKAKRTLAIDEVITLDCIEDK